MQADELIRHDHLCKPPALADRVCEGMICEGCAFAGESFGTANVTYLKFDGAWHRLCFDPDTVHWRIAPAAPAPPAAIGGFVYPHTDVGQLAGVNGMLLDAYCVSSDCNGTTAVFEFANGRTVVISYRDGCASFGIA